METLRVNIQIGNVSRECWDVLDAIVDTGTFMTTVPDSILRGLDITPTGTRWVRFADGKEARQMDIGYASVRFEGKEAITQVLFNDEETEPIIGWFALDGLFLEFDPDTRSFTPKVGLMPSILPVSEVEK